MTNLDLDKLLEVLGVNNRSSQHSNNRPINGLSIDSRSINKSDIYIAIKGKNFDGHSFVKQAFEKGASYCIISEKKLNGENCIVVENTKTALAQIGSFFLEESKSKVIAITGSNGKTTTKEAVLNILKHKFNEEYLLATEGNFNNEIGLPLTLFRLRPTHKITILEMGMNHKGEIENLAKIAPPDISIVTNIGEAHIENFKSRKDIALAKKELLINTKPTGTLILPFDDDYYELLVNDLGHKKITFGSSNQADIYYERENDLYSFYFQNKKIIEQIKFCVEHNATNFMAAIGAAIALDFSQEEFKLIKNFDLKIPHRLEFINTNSDVLVIDDCYNANPSSMKKAIDVLSKMEGHKIALIGDMAELGERSEKYHQDIINYLEEKKIDLIFRIGGRFKNIKTNHENNFWFPSKESLIESLKKQLKSNSIILIKGSRSMKMEDMIEDIQNY